jgi:predicted nucleic acid-binding protein
MIDVVYDANVLYSGFLRDFLLNIATVDIVCPHWSDEIHEEWISNLLRNRPDLLPRSLQRTRHRMEAEFTNSLTKGYESIVPTLTLPDPQDRHVLAVAIHTRSSWIVTFNLKDFPNTALQPFGIEALSPDEFVLRLIAKRPNRVLLAAGKHRLSLKNPPKTVKEYLATLEKQGLLKTVAFLREHENDI